MLKKRLMTPGPTPVFPGASLALGAEHHHHRTPEFKALITSLRARLGRIFRTEGETLLLTSSGTGAMEAALTSLTAVDDAVLVVDSGKFGHRWMDLAAAFGRHATALVPAAGAAVSPQEVGEAIRENSALTALFFAACESSTGVAADVKGLATAARQAAGEKLLVVVDAITQVGAAPLEMDAWDVDVAIGGSQKAFMMPPGLAFLALSSRAQERLTATGGGGLYFDLARELAAQRRGSTAWTPGTALAYALDAACEQMLAAGLPALWEATGRRARMTRAAVVQMGLRLYARSPAAALTAVLAPDGIDAGKIVSRLEADFGVRIAGGQGSLKGKLLRIAHLGYIDTIETLGTLGALGITLNRLGVDADTAGGLAAAVEVMGGSD
ncbi:MAG: pyridoxal-phosphate-dependent aminotransferase family protein [Acidobacteriota bacterium]